MNFATLKNHDGSNLDIPLELRVRLRNASQVPKLYYGLHFSEGVAEYRERGREPHRVLILENTAKQMDKTFPGRPVVVLHTDEDLEEMLPNIMEKADGFVVDSFFNQADGKHWTKFLAITDAAHEAIAKGWTLSNCYKIKSKGQGGMWHGVDYQNEVLEGAYEHLAIVPNPRYESKILSPEQFKTYNSQKEIELARLANSNNEGEGSMKFNIFKKTKVENSADLENTVIELPKSKKQMTITELVNAMDTIENMAGYCNMDHMVKVGEEEMSVNELVKRHMANESEKQKDLDADEGAGAQNDDEADEDAAEDLENEDDKRDDKEKAKNAKDKKAEDERLKNEKEEVRKAKKAAGKDHFDNLSNAADLARLKNEKDTEIMDTERAQLARGQERYGKK